MNTTHLTQHSGFISQHSGYQFKQNLTQKQFTVLKKLKKNKTSQGCFINMKQLSQELNMSLNTIRSIFAALTKKDFIISKEKFKIGNQQGLKVVLSESQHSESDFQHSESQLQHSIKKFKHSGTNFQHSESIDNTQSVEQNVENSNSLIRKKDSFQKIKIFLAKSDFWQKQNLTIKKIKSWNKEFSYCSEEFLLLQLQYAEFSHLVNKARSPTNYFYSCLKGGGMTKPEGYKSPEETAAEILQKEVNERQKALDKIEALNKKKQEIEKKEAFFVWLDDLKQIKTAVKEIEKNYMTSKIKFGVMQFKNKKQITESLQKRLFRYFSENLF